MTLPLMFNNDALGDVSVLVNGDGKTAAIGVQTLRAKLSRILNDEGTRRLELATGSASFVPLETLAASGFILSFNASELLIVVNHVDNDLRRAQTIGAFYDNQDRIPVADPADFSAYLNINAYGQYRDGGSGFEKPQIYLTGATRYKNIVLQYDTAFTRSVNNDYGFQRRGVRAIYDDVGSYRRYTAGDLQLSTLPILETQFVGGFSIEKRRRIFDPFAIPTPSASRRLIINSPSTVQVLVNGSVQRTVTLQPGVYNLSDLPIQYGSNNLQLQINGADGQQQLTNFNYYYDPIELLTGEDEYVAAVGFVSKGFQLQPEYSGDPVFIGFYRKAFTDSLALGAGAQISADRQVIAAQGRVIPKFLPGAFDFQAAMSFGQNTGYSVQAGYRWSGADPVVGRRISASIYYRSKNFRLLSDIFAQGESSFNVSASYSQNLTRRSGIIVGLNYVDGGAFEAEKSVYSDYYWQINDRVRAIVGGEYGEGGPFSRNYGIHVGLSIAFGNRTRLNSSYYSRRDSGQLSYSRSIEDHVGSLGYDASLNVNQGDTSGDLSAMYIGNRFTARATVIGNGQNGFGGFVQNPTATMQFGTSLAFADGSFGIGRPISDSFALVKPHASLDGRHVIAGRELNHGDYEARSGSLGAAVVPTVTAYNNQDVLYDVDQLPTGYDIGSGIVHVRPPLNSGSVITVGSANFVSALGTLQIAGKPAKILSGTMTSADDKQFTPQSFFTNSAGRFSVLGLAPGKTYSVKLFSGESFTISVPADNIGIYRLGVLNLPAAAE